MAAPPVHELLRLDRCTHDRGAAIAGEVGDFSLFPTAESLVKYSGLVPTQYQSGKVDRKGRMEKKGPALVRHSLIEASLKVVLHNPAWPPITGGNARASSTASPLPTRP